jgi:putative transcriptional regulator
MTHNNRSKRNRSLSANPTPAEVKAAREMTGLSQREAGRLIFRSLRTWQNWEFGERAMPPDSFALFLLLTNQLTLKDARAAATANLPEEV